MIESKYFKVLVDCGFIFDERFMKIFKGKDYGSRIMFKGFKLTNIRDTPITLYSNLTDGQYRNIATDFDYIKETWNREAEKQIKLIENLELLKKKI